MFQITFNIEHNRDQGASAMDDNLSIIEEELEQLEVNTSGEKQSVMVIVIVMWMMQWLSSKQPQQPSIMLIRQRFLKLIAWFSAILDC